MSSQAVTQITRREVWKLVQTGRHADAVAVLQPICQSAPGSAEAWYLLGCSFAKLTRWDEAVEALQCSVSLQPDVAQSHLALGGAWLALEQHERAEASLRATLELDDRVVEAHISLANIYLGQGSLARARAHLHRILEIKPANTDAYSQLGRLEQEAGNYDAALEYVEQALKSSPTNHRALCLKGSVLLCAGRTDEAMVSFREALQLAPDSVAARSGLVSGYEVKGDAVTAMELLDPLLEGDAMHPTLATAFARICRHVGRCDEAVACIDRIIDSPELLPSARRMLHFAAGKALDHMNQYDAAFRHYKAGNGIGRPLYDAVAHAQSIDDLIQAFSPQLFMRLPRARRNDARPVFILGMPRSGTSLTEQILASHPRVHGGGELDALGGIVKKIRHLFGCGERFSSCLDNMRQSNLDQLAEQYLCRLTELSGQAERVTDKMPHNFYYLGFIELLFPGARIIHCVRDPLDTGLSIYFQDFNQGHAYAKSLFDIGVHYHQYRRLMEHWKRVLSRPILEVQYEELIRDQERVSRRMLEFCDLEWDEKCLQFHNLDRAVHTSSYDQVRQPLYTESVARWRNYEPYLEELKEGLQRDY